MGWKGLRGWMASISKQDRVNRLWGVVNRRCMNRKIRVGKMVIGCMCGWA